MWAPDVAAAENRVTALLLAVESANLDAARGTARRGDGAARALWLGTLGPAIASFVPQSLARFGSSFRNATSPRLVRRARESHGDREYFQWIARRLAERAAEARGRAEDLLAALGELPGAEPHRPIAEHLSAWRDFWRTLENEWNTISEHLRDMRLPAAETPGFSEFEIARARRSWGVLADLAHTRQMGRNGIHA